MAAYRAALVWILRISAVAILASVAWHFVEVQRAVEAASAYSPVEAAGLQEPVLAIFLPAAGVSALCLTLAEILSLLMRQTRT